MADVTINQLTGQAPTNTDVFPFSTTGVTPSTYKASLTQIKTALGLATVATTGDYNDLINRPTIPTVNSVQLARAWVNFDGRGTNLTNQTIRANYNVDSVYKLGAGDYRINFTPGTFSDANYCAVGNGGRGVGQGWYGIAQSRELPTASTFRYVNYNGSNVGEDPEYAYFVFYR